MARPDTIDQAAQIAYDAILRRTGDDTELADIIRRGIHDAYRTGWNRALEGAAQSIESVDRDAAQAVRDHKMPEESL